MANISDAENIVYKCSNEKIASALFELLESKESKDAYYDIGMQAEIFGKTVNCSWGSGRWCFRSNIQFAYPDLPRYFDGLTPEIVNFIATMHETKGTIKFAFDDREEGGLYFAHVEGEIKSDGKEITVIITDESEIEPMECDMVKGYCESHESKQHDERYCAYVTDNYSTYIN